MLVYWGGTPWNDVPEFSKSSLHALAARFAQELTGELVLVANLNAVSYGQRLAGNMAGGFPPAVSGNGRLTPTWSFFLRGSSGLTSGFSCFPWMNGCLSARLMG